MTQAATGAAWLQSVMVGGGSFLPPPQSPGQASRRRMLFMGDSCESDRLCSVPAGCQGAVPLLTAQQRRTLACVAALA